VAAISLITVSACSENPTSETPTNVPSRVSNASEQEKGTEDSQLTTVPRFAVVISLDEKKMRLGEPFDVAATVTSLVSSTSPAVISIRMPELEVARRNDWRIGRIPIGEALPSLREEKQTFSVGQAQTFRHRVTVPVAGLFRVSVTASVDVKGAEYGTGKPVQDFVAVERWIWIDENGSRISETLRDVVVPDTVFALPGLRRLHEPTKGRSSNFGRGLQDSAASLNEGESSPDSKRSSIASRTARRESIGVSADPTPGMVSGHVVYYNPNTHVFDGAPLSWTYQIWDDYENQYMGSNFGLTDADGSFAFPCPDPNDFAKRHDLSFAIQNFFVSINTGSIAAGQYRGLDCTPQGIDGDFIIDSNEGVAIATMARVINDAYQIFGRTRPHVYVSVSNAHADSRFMPPNNIRLRSTANALFSPHGYFAMAHEYGHALHHSSMGGFPGGCPTVHYPEDYTNMDCAWTEGFADFFAVAVLPSAVNGFLPAYETNYYYGGGNGSIVEGAVAAFLLDLVDAGVEPHDTLSFPGAYIADLITSCTRIGPFSAHATRVAHVIYCLENQVDPVAQAFFPGDYSILWYSESAIEPPGWTPTRVRRAWLKNLFNQ